MVSMISMESLGSSLTPLCPVSGAPGLACSFSVLCCHQEVKLLQGLLRVSVVLRGQTLVPNLTDGGKVSHQGAKLFSLEELLKQLQIERWNQLVANI